MDDIAIRIENLSKRYHIGRLQDTKRNLRETLTEACAVPFRRAVNMLLGNYEDSDAQSEHIWALRNISFDVKRGESVAIIGPNGAGKTTLLKILSRITKPTEGHAEIYGRVGSLLEIGTGFHPELTGRENIYLSGAILGMRKKEIDRKFDEIVNFSEIQKFLDTPVKHYSSGMNVRLAFGVAAHLEPEILLVDEVLAVGDVQFQKKCLGKMEDVAQQGRTVLFVSHNMMAVRGLCSRALLLKSGAIEHEGDVAEVIQHYLEENRPPESQKVWNADNRPGNHLVKIDSVHLKNNSGQEVSEIPLSQEAVIEINYEVINEGTRTAFAVTLYDVADNLVCSSLSNQEKNFYGTPMPAGRYTTCCRIYENLLNAGRYYVTITVLGNNWSDGFKVDHVIFLEAVDDGVLRGDYYGGFRGPIRPKLEWQTTRCESPASPNQNLESAPLKLQR